MSTIPPPRPSGMLPRRLFVGALSMVALAGCQNGQPAQPPARSTQASSPPPGPDPLLTDIADTTQLLSVYDRTLRAHAPLAPRLRPIRADHAAHLEALLQAVGVASPAPSGPPPGVPKAPAAALARLRSLEGTAAAARTRSAIRSSGGRAALLASIAASCAAHAVVLA
jgi:hypothetical protein